MRHCNRKGRLSRRTSWRKATLKALANDLLTYQRIQTTMAKAKALRQFVEPIITIAKNDPDSVNAKRRVYARLCDRGVVTSLFGELAPLYKDVPGGYTRIMGLGNRRGDGAKMVVIELTKRTISDDDLLGIIAKEPATKKKAKKGKEAGKGKTKEAEPKEKEGEARHAAPEIDIEKKEERVVEDVKKEKAKTEQKKISQQGFFKRFRRKSI